jgi:hypothetical protein
VNDDEIGCVIEGMTPNEMRSMLIFFFDQMECYSVEMDGKRSYRFRNGWPMTHCVGRFGMEAVVNAMNEVHRYLRVHGNDE